jgi:hypothetical protein
MKTSINLISLLCVPQFRKLCKKELIQTQWQ